MSLQLEPVDTRLLAGADGPGPQLAMRLLTGYARALRARRFIDISGAHIDACLYHGRSSQDFVDRFVALGTRVKVPTTMNVGAVDGVSLHLNRGDPALAPLQAALTEAYVRLGCVPTLTCAPYQRLIRPRAGEHVAWAESNAIVFANSVLGARTDRYGDFADLCAAITGRAPLAGLHLSANRAPGLILDMPRLEEADLPRDLYFASVGYVSGTLAGDRVAALTGLPGDTSEADFKALGAAAATSGAVAMFHAVGLTPEAPDLPDLATRGLPRFDVSASDLKAAIVRLAPVEIGEHVAAVCLGTPHFSVEEFSRLCAIVDETSAVARVPVFVSTSREIAERLAGTALGDSLEAFGVTLVVDTCTYVARFGLPPEGVVLTNSAKWAHYAPGNIGRRAGLAGLEACVRSAVAARVVP